MNHIRYYFLNSKMNDDKKQQEIADLKAKIMMLEYKLELALSVVKSTKIMLEKNRCDMCSSRKSRKIRKKADIMTEEN